MSKEVTNTMYTVILFDFFGVFCTPIATNWFKKAVPNDVAKLAAFQALCTESDYGKLPRADFNIKASQLAGVPVDQLVHGIEAETHINISLVQYAHDLKSKGYRIACLSNGAREWTLQVIVDHGLHDLFEEVVLSGEVGVVKPSPEIYWHTLKKLRVAADEVIFVDDRKDNTDAAERCGIHSLVFTDTPSFVRCLSALIESA